MRVDIVDVRRSQAGEIKGDFHGPRSAFSARPRLRDVVGVGCGAVADHFSQRLSAAGFGVLEGLQEENTGAFAQHEAVPLSVEWPGGALRVVVARGYRGHGVESRHADRADGGFGSAGERRVRGAAPYDLERLSNGVCTRRTGRHGGEVESLGAGRHRNLGGAHVRQHHRDEERANAARSSIVEDRHLLRERLDPADAAAHEHRDAPGVLFRHVQTRVLHRFERGNARELCVPVDTPRLLASQSGSGIEPDDLCGDSGFKPVSVERLDVVDPRPAFHESLPGRSAVEANGADDPETGYNDAFCHMAPLLCGTPVPAVPQPGK